METVVFVCVDKSLSQRLAAASVLQDVQPLHVKDADQLFALKNGDNTLEAVFIGPSFQEPVRLAQRLHGAHSDVPILICRLPEEYDEVRRALQFAPMLGDDVTCTTTSDAVDVELQAAIFRTRQRRRMRAAISASNAALTGSLPKRGLALRYVDRLLDAAPIGVLALDPEHRILDWNRKAAEIFDFSNESLTGKLLFDFFPGEQWAELQALFSIALTSTQEALLPVAKRTVGPGVHQFLEIRAVQLQTDCGNASLLCILQDITERKRAEAALHQQWHIFDTALSNTPDFAYIFDLDGRFTYSNSALLALWQKPLEDAIGRNFFDLGYPPELAERLQGQIRKVIETSETVRDDTPFTGPTGETRQYEYIFVPVLGVDGRVEAVTGSTRDITVRIEAEEALRTSEERLTLALEAGGGVGIWDWDIRLDRVFCDPQFAKLFSIEPGISTTGVSISQFVARIHSDDRSRVGAKIQEAVDKGGNFAEEYRVVQQDGSVRWVHARGRCHVDKRLGATRFPGVVFDITDRKRAEEALRESQNRLRAIYDGTYEYIGLVAPDGTLLDCNRASLTFANNTHADVLGRPFWDTPWFTATPGAPEALRDAVKRAAAGEFIRYEVLLFRPSGEGRTFDFSLHPIRNEEGRVVLLVPEGRDITDRKSAEEEVARSNEELKRVNRELEEFAFVASHDIQEPLRMVNIYTQLILKSIGPVGAKVDQYATFVQQGVTRMEDLIHDLLTFSRAVHTDELPIGTADLSASLEEAVSVLKNLIDESGSVIAAAPLPTVRGDAAQMGHVFQNLISNALKYRKKAVPLQVDVHAHWDGAYWTTSVRDNGIGFEPRYAERIFGLFKRLHKDEYAGTGLGLAICKRIVERYGGRIWAEGQLGEGATFHFSLLPAEGGSSEA